MHFRRRTEISHPHHCTHTYSTSSSSQLSPISICALSSCTTCFYLYDSRTRGSNSYRAKYSDWNNYAVIVSVLVISIDKYWCRMPSRLCYLWIRPLFSFTTMAYLKEKTIRRIHRHTHTRVYNRYLVRFCFPGEWEATRNIKQTRCAHID